VLASESRERFLVALVETTITQVETDAFPSTIDASAQRLDETARLVRAIKSLADDSRTPAETAGREEKQTGFTSG
jgi:hypothetical protein